ncbi:alpha/beta hydrolase [Streptomyces kaempferi]
MVQRTDELIRLPDGTVLGAWLFLPEGPGPHPAVTMTHGFGGTKYHQGIEAIARRIAEAGFAVSLHDHRGFGDSTGEPRQDIDPYRQIEDWRRVISHLQTLDSIDADRIGVWGTSYSGGHALVLGATDRRITAVYSQVPTISGSQSSRRRVPPHLTRQLEQAIAADELNQARGGQPASQAFVSDDPTVPPPTVPPTPSTSTCGTTRRRACGRTASRSSPTGAPVPTTPATGSTRSRRHP